MRLSGVFDTIFTIFKRNVANYPPRRVRDACKNKFSTSLTPSRPKQINVGDFLKIGP